MPIIWGERLRLGRRIGWCSARRRSTKATPGFRLSVRPDVRPDRRSNAALEALASGGIDAHNTDYNLNAAIGAAYGITYQLTISAELPYVRRDHLREAETIDETVDLGNVSGALVDLSILAKYRLFHNESSGVALIGGIKLPTGSTHQRSRDGERLETERRPGTGSWDPIFGASLGDQSRSRPADRERAHTKSPARGRRTRGSAIGSKAGSRYRIGSVRQSTITMTRALITTMATNATIRPRHTATRPGTRSSNSAASGKGARRWRGRLS